MQPFNSVQLYSQMVELRRVFHRQPELAFEEVQSAISGKEVSMHILDP